MGGGVEWVGGGEIVLPQITHTFWQKRTRVLPQITHDFWQQIEQEFCHKLDTSFATNYFCQKLHNSSGTNGYIKFGRGVGGGGEK